jgi:hypothetical protein
MPYSIEALENMRGCLAEIPPKATSLRDGYAVRSYSHRRGREYAFNGFLRRISVLERCIAKVFEILPPDKSTLPAREELYDSDIYLHAFVFNTFGSLDNLAWIWVYERLTGGGRPEIRSRDVSLNRENSSIRRSFSPAFQSYLMGLSSWFRHQENYRHALAHRIPLYVPPYAVPTDRQGEYDSLGARMHDAIARRDFEELDRLEAAQIELAAFQPRMIHSFEERSTPILFHRQLLEDFLTIDEIGRKMLEELDVS